VAKFFFSVAGSVIITMAAPNRSYEIKNKSILFIAFPYVRISNLKFLERIKSILFI